MQNWFELAVVNSHLCSWPCHPVVWQVHFPFFAIGLRDPMGACAHMRGKPSFRNTLILDLQTMDSSFPGVIPGVTCHLEYPSASLFPFLSPLPPSSVPSEPFFASSIVLDFVSSLSHQPDFIVFPRSPLHCRSTALAW